MIDPATKVSVGQTVGISRFRSNDFLDMRSPSIESSALLLFPVMPLINTSDSSLCPTYIVEDVKARYSKHFRITLDELQWLSVRVEELGRVVHLICTEHIHELTAAASKVAEQPNAN